MCRGGGDSRTKGSEEDRLRSTGRRYGDGGGDSLSHGGGENDEGGWGRTRTDKDTRKGGREVC